MFHKNKTLLLFSFFLGSVVANRLSENPNWNILLLEAGDFEPEVTDVPILYSNHQLSSIDWNYTTTSQSHACLGECTLYLVEKKHFSKIIKYL